MPILLLLGLAAVVLAVVVGGSSNASANAPQQLPPGQPGGNPLPPGALGGKAPLQNFWDPGLSQVQVVAITTALNTETDPNKLDAFAKSLLPEFPIAAAALSSRAIALRLAQGALPIPGLPITPPPLPNFPIPTPPGATPAVFPVPNVAGTPAIVTTQETGPNGRLNVRLTPDSTSSANIIGFYEHGANISVMGPSINGFVPTTDGSTSGFASSQFITPVAALGGAAPGSPLVVPASAGPTLVGTPATITTNDTGPSGNLNVRVAPNGTIIGQVAHGATVLITGPASSGFFPITGHGVNGLPISGFASTQFVTPGAQSVSAGFDGAGASLLRVVTNGRGPLGLRVAPNSKAQFCAQAPEGATFRAAGPSVNGFVPLRDDAGRTAWAMAAYLAAVPSSTSSSSAGAAPSDDVSAGPSLPFAELHAAALELKTALGVNGCRSYNEPKVKRFQRAAKASGLYSGLPDGWYGVDTQAALSKIVGKPAPACFPEPTGGPSNPQEYWSPMGV